MRVMWAWRSGLNDIEDWFLRRKLKKCKHVEDVRFGSERMRRRVVGLSLERREVEVESRSFGGDERGFLEMRFTKF